MDKDHIIREIRRTAAQNGGTPYGSRRFETETGIRDAHWLGKYWARWSDALREAGFEPNQLQRAYDTAHLLDHYAALARELGRLPTANDLRMKDRIAAGFPSQTSFERLGTKAELVRMLRDHCATRDGYDDVIALCDAYAPRAENTREPLTPTTAEGTVYLLRSGRFFKIGRTNSAGRREYELALQLPEKASTVHTIATDDPVGIEAYWHRRFDAKRKNGEWFELDAADVAAFRRRKFM
jgi:hypothetical protein